MSALSVARATSLVDGLAQGGVESVGRVDRPPGAPVVRPFARHSSAEDLEVPSTAVRSPVGAEDDFMAYENFEDGEEEGDDEAGCRFPSTSRGRADCAVSSRAVSVVDTEPGVRGGLRSATGATSVMESSDRGLDSVSGAKHRSSDNRF